MCDHNEVEAKREAQRIWESQQKYSQTGTGPGCDAMCARPMTAEELIEEGIKQAHYRMDYHAPNSSQLPRFQALRDAAKNFATIILRNCPQYSDETRFAVQALEQVLMFANKSIALENLPKL